MDYELGVFIEELSKFSAEGPGVTRVPFTKESRQGWEYICQTMEDIGLIVKTDAYGTVLGHLDGQKKESVIIGSHYDSVVQGGKYDGVAGIAIGLAVAAYFVRNGINPVYSLDILATNDEEGGTFTNGFLSSKYMCGMLQEEECKSAMTGKTLKEFLAEQWYTKSGKGTDDLRLETALKDVVQYIEPHIEQGGILWDSQEQIGIVKHIVGITRLYVTVSGVSNHTGTTSMDKRKDAMVAASQMICSIPNLVRPYQGAVATVGQISCNPNSSNVIPGQVKFSVDIRSANNDDMENLAKDIREMVMRESIHGFDIVQWEPELAIPMNNELVKRMEKICKKQGISYRIMNSGAGHDAQLFARKLDTVMLFVPSENGISHNPEEFTRTEDMEQAVKILVSYLS
ncbi:MAG TPA: Zn-dependent hydrolase [Clostridium sp.]|nr:Zn-dependent hydrolase [Clostridium sp.]